ncbi:peptidylprolyl isomerase [Pseudomonas resinovorans]|nr:peptidylprolyl isomerase [Pseudomonas resinovorans]MDA8482760.1 peptidylprolyl isomerase [Pseudomonas resinovorans]
MRYLCLPTPVTYIPRLNKQRTLRPLGANSFADRSANARRPSTLIHPSIPLVSGASTKEEYPTMARATARHILVSSEAKCNELKAAIEAGADFAEIAKQHSTCPSSRDGGNLGSFGRGQMVKEFDTVVFSAPLNVVQGPVKTQFGYHLLEVTSRQD